MKRRTCLWTQSRHAGQFWVNLNFHCCSELFLPIPKRKDISYNQIKVCGTFLKKQKDRWMWMAFSGSFMHFRGSHSFQGQSIHLSLQRGRRRGQGLEGRAGGGSQCTPGPTSCSGSRGPPLPGLFFPEMGSHLPALPEPLIRPQEQPCPEPGLPKAVRWCL